MLDCRRSAMDTQYGDIGTVYGAAHIQATSKSNTQLSRQILVGEAVTESIHDAFHDTAGISSRRVTMHPALSVNDVADGVISPADWETFVQ